MTQRTILHLDIDAFFASVEKLLNPFLATKPVIVGGYPGERSVVASCSYEARACGVHSGMSLSQAHRLCPDAVFLKGDFRNYSLVRDQIREILFRFSPSVAFTSIDDAYVDLTGLESLHSSHPFETACRIREAVLARTGVSLSMGIGTSPVMARIASACAKPAGILFLLPGYERSFLEEMQVERLPGVGRKTGRVLDNLNIRTIGDLARIPSALLEAAFGKNGRKMSEKARGIDPSAVAEREIPASVSRETTFPRETSRRSEVESMLHYLTERAASFLRRKQLSTSSVEVKIRYADFRTEARRRAVPQGATDQERVLFPVALAILGSLITRRVRIRLVGITLLSLSRRVSERQGVLPFSSLARRAADEAFYAGIDRVRDRFGFGALIGGRSIEMLGKVRRTRHGFILRTPSLTR